MQYTRVTGNYWAIYWKLPKMLTFFQHFCCYSFIKFINTPKFSGSKAINFQRISSGFLKTPQPLEGLPGAGGGWGWGLGGWIWGLTGFSFREVFKKNNTRFPSQMRLKFLQSARVCSSFRSDLTPLLCTPNYIP